MRRASPPLASRSLRALCLDLVGRPPYLAERERWLGRPREELVAELLAGEEFWENWVAEQLYYLLLIDNFRPESPRVVALPAALAAGETGVRGALHQVLLSASFDRRNPGPDTFVTVVLEQVLGMTVQRNERELRIGRKLYEGGSGTFLGRSGRSQSDVVRIAIEDQRACTHLLRREHTRILRAELPRERLTDEAAALHAGTRGFRELLAGWLASEAYEERLATWRPLPSRLFVQTLAVDLLDRRPDPDEARRVRSALDGLAEPGPLRSVVARLFLATGGRRLASREEIEDPTAWVRGLFDRLLSRAPTEEELRTFVSAYHDPDSTPNTVRYAILSHPEYHHW